MALCSMPFPMFYALIVQFVGFSLRNLLQGADFQMLSHDCYGCYVILMELRFLEKRNDLRKGYLHL